MMLQERRRQIVEKIKKDRMIKAADLVEEYGVSVETIRRDLEYLESAGILRRVYGGAVVDGLYGQEPVYSHRQIANYEEKCAIGVRAADFIEDGDIIFFDVGTTALEVAKNLRDKKNLTVITNATFIAQEVTQLENSRVILLGGEIRPGELSVSGSISIENIKRFYADKLIMGVGGINAKNGFTDYHIGESEIRRAMIEHSNKIIAVADFSKFGVTAMNYVCPISKVDKVVVDWSVSEEDIRDLREKGIDVIVADKI